MGLLIEIVIVLVIVGVVLYLINTYIPMAPPIKTILNVIVILIVCLWLLSVLGLFSGRLPFR